MDLQSLLNGLTDQGEVVWFDENGEPFIEGKQDEEEEDIPSNNEWIETTDGDYFPAKNTKIKKTLPPGEFEVTNNQGKYYCSKVSNNNDELYRMPNDKIDTIIAEIGRFWDKADLFDKEGIVHKRGIILHGHPGCGKTSTINILVEDVVKRGGLIFRVKSTNDLQALITFVHGYLRDIQPDTPVIVVVEDIDALVHANESMILNWLSGDDEFNHCIIVATTNRLHELNDLLLRPSRFDWIIELEAPSEEERRFYLEKKGLEEETLNMWVPATKDFTMAQLKELYIAVRLLDNDFDAVINKLKNQKKAVKNNTFNPIKGSIGFGVNKN